MGGACELRSELSGPLKCRELIEGEPVIFSRKTLFRGVVRSFVRGSCNKEVISLDSGCKLFGAAGHLEFSFSIFFLLLHSVTRMEN